MDPRLVDELRRWSAQPVGFAEIRRRLGSTAERLNLAQPSYTRVRELVLLEREQRDQAAVRRELWAAVAGDLAAGLVKRPFFRVLEHMEERDAGS